MANVYKYANAVAAFLTGESEALDDAAGRIRRSAALSAAKHRNTGAYSGNFHVMTVSDRTKRVKDRLVYNAHPESMSIELGHFAQKKKEKDEETGETKPNDGTPGDWVPGQFNLLHGVKANEVGG